MFSVIRRVSRYEPCKSSISGRSHSGPGEHIIFVSCLQIQQKIPKIRRFTEASLLAVFDRIRSEKEVQS